MTPTELKAHRAELGLTQSQMAEQVGMKLRGYQRLEGAERAISGTLARLVQRLIDDKREAVEAAKGETDDDE